MNNGFESPDEKKGLSLKSMTVRNYTAITVL
jgi:hypothetical protein